MSTWTIWIWRFCFKINPIFGKFLVSGEGKSKKVAKVAAAQKMMDHLEDPENAAKVEPVSEQGAFLEHS